LGVRAHSDSARRAGDACLGRTPVRATVDGQSWNTSVWRAKDGRSLLAVPKKVRGNKDNGDIVVVELLLGWV
jgi:hypothetical protein